MLTRMFLLLEHHPRVTTLLSAVISNSAADHHLNTDDTQILLLFSVLDFSHDLTHLENTVTNVSN